MKLKIDPLYTLMKVVLLLIHQEQEVTVKRGVVAMEQKIGIVREG